MQAKEPEPVESHTRETPTPVMNRATFRIPNPSAIKTVKKAEAVTSNDNKKVKAFTKTDLEKEWMKYSEAKKNLVAEYQVLTQPFSLEGNVVYVSLTNPAQETLLDGLKQDLIIFLRENLENDGIQVVGKVEEQTTTKFIYGADEKLEFLANKNPEIRELTKRFGLDPDF